MRSCPLFAAVLSGMGGRSRRSERMLGAMQAQLNRMETMMSTLLDKIKEAQDAVNAERKAHADEVAALKEQLAKAWDADHEADYQAGLAKMDELIASLSKPSPVFTPSGN